ncbi:hypothetical protein C6341_g1678 [Phytophthora cactorum]|nr:hypothetical protein C6341_g1678 [Phytophthora cactorum]
MIPHANGTLCSGKLGLYCAACLGRTPIISALSNSGMGIVYGDREPTAGGPPDQLVPALGRRVCVVVVTGVAGRYM